MLDEAEVIAGRRLHAVRRHVLTVGRPAAMWGTSSLSSDITSRRPVPVGPCKERAIAGTIALEGKNWRMGCSLVVGATLLLPVPRSRILGDSPRQAAPGCTEPSRSSAALGEDRARDGGTPGDDAPALEQDLVDAYGESDRARRSGEVRPPQVRGSRGWAGVLGTAPLTPHPPVWSPGGSATRLTARPSIAPATPAGPSPA
jgi:hypothetical protein